MLRLHSRITFTPAASDAPSGLPQFQTGSEVYKQLNRPLTAPRKEIVFDFVNEVEVHTSHRELTSTARITIPRKLTFEGQTVATGTAALFRRGDRVKIECGYYPNLRTRFVGYIADVSINAPIVIECEDEMFVLAKKHVLYPAANALVFKTTGKRGNKLKTPKIIPKKMKLKDFIRDVVLDGTPYADTLRCDIDMEIAILRFDCSAREALNKLKETFTGLYAYFENGALVVGFLNDANYTVTENFYFERTVINDRSLQYRREEDVQLICRATSYDVDTGDQVSVTWPPDVGPETPSAHVDVFTTKKMTKDDLVKFAQKNCESRKYEGYRGSFETFGEPMVNPGDAAKLIDEKYPERNGTYLVQSVRVAFGMNGYRQNIELGPRVAFD